MNLRKKNSNNYRYIVLCVMGANNSLFLVNVDMEIFKRVPTGLRVEQPRGWVKALYCTFLRFNCVTPRIVKFIPHSYGDSQSVTLVHSTKINVDLTARSL